jgi:hypothetical protein
VHAAAADGCRQVVDRADVLVVDTAVGGAPERAGLDERIGTEEVALGELQLVVREVVEQAVRVVEVDEVVAAPLEDADRPAGSGQYVGGGGAAGARPDDDGVEVVRAARTTAQGSATSSSE